MIIKKNKYDCKVDIWSAGIIVHFLLQGSHPFIGHDQKELYEKILNEVVTLNSKDWVNISQPAQAFGLLCLEKDPASRPTCSELLKHKWLHSAAGNRDDVTSSKLMHVSQNLQKFCKLTNFEKTITSLLTGLLIQKSELEELKKVFYRLDTNKDGRLSKEELENGLQNLETSSIGLNSHDSTCHRPNGQYS